VALAHTALTGSIISAGAAIQGTARRVNLGATASIQNT
jgi:hypothetical protein